MSHWKTYEIENKIYSIMIEEYEELGKFFKSKDKMEIIKIISRRKRKLTEKSRECFNKLLYSIKPKREISNEEYDRLVILAHHLDLSDKKFHQRFSKIQRILDKKRIDFLFLQIICSLKKPKFSLNI
jgi:hypothetical protein